jgi:hypothetical protein
MANAFFRLRKVKAKTPQIIYAGYKFGKDQLIYPTGLKITPNYWNFKSTRVKHIISNPHPNRDLINSKLEKIENFINYTAERFKHSEPPTELTKNILKSELDNYLNPPKVVTITFFDFIQSFMDDCKTGKKLNDGMRMAERTIKNYGTGFSGLKEYETYTGETITFESLNRKYWQEYVHYLTMVKKYKINTIGSYQKYLIVFLRECKRAKLWEDKDNLLDDAKILTENPVDVYLNKIEIAKMEQLDLSNNERLDKVGLGFRIGCKLRLKISKLQAKKMRTLKLPKPRQKRLLQRLYALL